MRAVHRLALVAVLAALALPAGAAAAGPASDLRAQTNGPVSAVAQLGDRAFLGGTFTRAGIPTGASADLSQSSAAPNHAFAAPNGDAYATVSDGAGGWYIGGVFTSVGGVARNRLAHLLADGSVDPAFDPDVDGIVVWSLALSGSTLYVGGRFSAVGGLARNRVAAIDVHTGEPTAFVADMPDGLDPESGVDALAISGSRLYVGGQYPSPLCCLVTPNRLLAFDTQTGARIASFAPMMNGTVLSLATAGGKLYAGGYFGLVDGVTRPYMMKLDETDGTVDPLFNPRFDTQVLSIVVDGARVYAGGNFTTVNDGVVRRNLAALDATTGALDPAFNANIDPSVPLSCAVAADEYVNALALAGGTLFGAGCFKAAGRVSLAAFDAATGAVRGGFDAKLAAASMDPALIPSAWAVAVAGSRVYVTGNFTWAGADTLHTNLAAINADGTPDAGFNPTVNGNPLALATAAGKLYVGGQFTVAGTPSAPRNRLVAFDAATGAVDPAFNPNLNARVLALHAAGGKLYAGGEFTTVGATPRNRLAAFDTATGALDQAFVPSLNSGVFSLATAGDTLYAGGNFTTVNATPHARLAALDAASGALRPGFAQAPNGTPTALALNGGKLYAGGWFSTVGATPRNRLAAFDAATGALDPEFDPNLGSGNVNALAILDDVVYAGGSFRTVNGGVPRDRLAALDATTGRVGMAFDPAPNGDVNALLASGPRLLAGGAFTTIGGRAQQSVARFGDLPAIPDAPAVTTGSAGAVGTVTATVAGTVDPNGEPTAYVVEYGPSAAFGSISTPLSAGSGDAAAPISVDLTGLTANTTYYYRLVATSSAGTTFGAVRSFRTTGTVSAPLARTGAATAVTSSSATLAGQVNPSGQQTAYTFEYGTSTSFGQITPVVALDDADALEPVTATLTGLQPGTTYFYRLVATNATGTTTGAVMTATTGGDRTGS